ncbi:hypothetical protein CRI65_12435 [Escherichia sp. E3659]|nr:hypothetical protein CRI65_12435 [Escherichia sp. E3659]
MWQVFLQNKKINNLSQCNYISSLVVLTIKIAKATDSTVFAHCMNTINIFLFLAEVRQHYFPLRLQIR